MKHFIYQGNDTDCGFTSLKMLLATVSHDDSYLFISKPEKKGNHSLKELEDIADSFGLKLESFSCEEEYLDRIKCPCLTIINSNHTVMIKRKTKHFILVYDPGEGIRVIRKKKFLKIWTKIIVEIEDKKSVQKIGKIRRRILPLKKEIFQVATSCISTAALIASFYFFNNIKNFWYSFIFLGVFLISQLAESFLIYKHINYFDETYIPLYFNKDNNKNRISYDKFLSFKRNYFVSNRGLISLVLIIFIIVFLLSFNNPKNILAITIILLLKLLEKLLFSGSEKTTSEIVGNFEKKSFENLDENSVYLLKANKLANFTVFCDSFKSLVFIFICFSLSICMMLLTDNFGCDFVIFHFIFYFVFYKSFSELLDGLQNKQKLLKEESRFYEDCNL